MLLTTRKAVLLSTHLALPTFSQTHPERNVSERWVKHTGKSLTGPLLYSHSHMDTGEYYVIYGEGRWCTNPAHRSQSWVCINKKDLGLFFPSLHCLCLTLSWDEVLVTPRDSQGHHPSRLLGDPNYSCHCVPLPCDTQRSQYYLCTEAEKHK